MNQPDVGLIGRRFVFVAVVAGLVGTIEIATVWLEHGPGQAHWLARALGQGVAAAVLVSAMAAMMGRFFFFLPLSRASAAIADRERLYRLLANDSADLILRIGAGDPDPVVAGAMKALLGYEADEIRATTPLAFVHPEERETVQAHLEQLSQEHPRAEMTVRLRHETGDYIWTDVRLHRLDHSTSNVETFVTIRDVSGRHREAEELRQATLAAQGAQAEADRANAAKTEFLACMSHEIRTPLNSVIGFAGLLLADGNDTSRVRLYAERIQASGNALLTVVDDILDFSGVEAGVVGLEHAPFSLPTLIDECVSIVQQAALAKQLSLQVSLHDQLRPGVFGDASRLRQILLNLLNNAIKFTDQGSVLLDIRYDRTEGRTDHIRFSVVDTGIGIARVDLPRLFHRFQQVDGSIRRIYGGTGLGLAICKKLVELMGGTIKAESETGVGSTFSFTIPLPPATLPAPDARCAIPIAVGPCHILLVEDVPINQDLVRHILEAGGHTVDIVGNGAEAVMAVLDADYDLVLMDLQMPHVDGLTATRMIRDLPHRCRDVPIIAMTANVLPEQTDVARAAGMADVIHKPFSATQIYATLERVVTGTMVGASEDLPVDALGKLVGLLGAAKVKDLLRGLARSLVERFDADAATAPGRAILKRQAHASVAGAGMLGFTRFAAACKAFELAPEDDAFVARLTALQVEATDVIATAEAIASGAMPLGPKSVAA